MIGLEPCIEAIQVEIVTPVYRKAGDQLVFPHGTAPWPTLLILWTWSLAWNIGKLNFAFGVFWVVENRNMPDWVMALFTAVGIAVFFATLALTFVRHDWVMQKGCISRRWRIPLLGLVHDSPHYDVCKIEYRRGHWRSGEGHTDHLRYRRSEKDEPVILGGIQFLRRKASQNEMELLAAEQSLSPPTGWLAPLTRIEFSARLFDIESTRRRNEMGELIAATVGVDYEWVDEVIRDPPTD
jgi:hypothetical protein